MGSVDSAKTQVELAVLLTCHNRVDKTVRCLDVLFEQVRADAVDVSVFLVDDGSTDGTADRVRDRYPIVHVIEGDGTLFWNRGMHRAFQAALDRGFDYYLWLNDDTYLLPGSVRRMLAVHRELVNAGSPKGIVVGSTRDPETGKFTYGGYVRENGWNKLKLRLVPPGEQPIPCDTFCGNCVLIPRAVADVVGNIDPVFRHRWGDVDYGLRASSAGCSSWIAPGYAGECDDNPRADQWRDPALPMRERIRELHGIKGLGKEDWPVYVRRHGGWLWPVFLMLPYARIVLDTFGVRPARSTAGSES